MRHAIAALGAACAAAAVVVVAADRGFSPASAAAATVVAPEEEISLLNKIADFMWRSDGNSYQHVWPVLLRNKPQLFEHFILQKSLTFWFPSVLYFPFV
jgi:hypothetical protein